MACGKPCVVTVVGDSALIVQKSGVVVPPEDPLLLASGISAMLDGLSGIDPLKIWRRISESFTIEKMVDGTEKALQDVLDGGWHGTACYDISLNGINIKSAGGLFPPDYGVTDNYTS